MKRKILGVILISLPFIALAAFLIKTAGILPTLIVFGLGAAIVICILAGVKLLIK